MAIARFGRQAKRTYHSFGFCSKITAVSILGLLFVIVWSVSSPSFSSVSFQRSTFDDIAEPVPANEKVSESQIHSYMVEPNKGKVNEEGKKGKHESNLKKKDENLVNGLPLPSVNLKRNGKEKANVKRKKKNVKRPAEAWKDKDASEGSEGENITTQEEGEGGDAGEEAVDGEDTEVEGDADLEKTVDGDQEDLATVDDASEESGNAESKMKKKNLGPLFDPNAQYSWKLCSTRSKHNYIPCIDIELATKRLRSYRHWERSCPKSPVMCLPPLPTDGYGIPVKWPECKLKILYKNIAHPKLAAFAKTHSWMVESGEYLTFPQNQSEFKGGILHYLDSIEEMVPDIEWGKRIHVVLDIGCGDSSFAASLLEKDVLTLTLGLKDDLVDLAQVALERGFPAVVSPLGTRRLSFPSGVFDTIHCGDCHVTWNHNGGLLLLEMNRILRPGGYFIMSTKHDSIEDEKAMSTLTASMGWNILAHKTDEDSELGVKIYQKPDSNDVLLLLDARNRGFGRKRGPLLCKETENPDAAWYVHMKTCLHRIPSAIEQRGVEWPEEWPERLETYPDWMNNREKLVADTKHWKAIIDKSYLVEMGIDWSNVRNVMDMKAIHGGFAAALTQQKVWVMNVVPVHAPNTLPIIFERGLVGIYHDWCESFGSYPRSYDLLHADHLFSRLKNSCKHPVTIVVEMDRLLRPGGWVIVRDKVEITEPLERILRSLHWEIRMTFSIEKEGILCAQKTTWRP